MQTCFPTTMAFCRECGGQVEDTWKFCPHCNAQQNPESQTGENVPISIEGGWVEEGGITQNITQNNPDDIATAMVSALERLGFAGQSSPAELTPEETKEVEEILEASEQLAGHGIEIDPWTEITLGNAAKLAGRTHTAQQHYQRALETFRKNSDRQGEAASVNNLGINAQIRGDLDEAERLLRESLAIKREIGDRQGEAMSVNNLGTIADERGDLDEAERLHRESLAIRREIGDRRSEADSLINLGNTLLNRNMDEQPRCYTEAVRIRREIGIPIEQWFIDNGY